VLKVLKVLKVYPRKRAQWQSIHPRGSVPSGNLPPAAIYPQCVPSGNLPPPSGNLPTPEEVCPAAIYTPEEVCPAAIYPPQMKCAQRQSTPSDN